MPRIRRKDLLQKPVVILDWDLLSRRLNYRLRKDGKKIYKTPKGQVHQLGQYWIQSLETKLPVETNIDLKKLDKLVDKLKVIKPHEDYRG